MNFLGLNFLVPTAVAYHGDLKEALEDAGGRADLVVAYRTCWAIDSSRKSALLAGGGIDCVAFANPSELRQFAEVFDTNDLGRLLAGVTVACIDQDTAQTAVAFGLTADIIPKAADAPALASALAFHFSR